jgi:hypothetical protein
MYDRFNNLNGGSCARLAQLRRYVNQWNTDPRKGTRIDWRRARMFGIASIKSDGSGIGRDSTGRTLPVPLSLVNGWRHVKENPRGWYTDEDQSETYTGSVWQLPARNGTPQYVAGYIEENADYAILGATRGQLDIHDDADDAMRAADSLAEQDAETEREYQERWHAASDAQRAIDDASDAIKAAREQAHKAADALREQRAAGIVALGVCSILREQIERARRALHEALGELETARDNRADYKDIEV